MAKRRSRKWIYIIGGAFLILLLFIFVGKSKGWIGKPKAEEVLLAKVKTGAITEKVSASGKIQPETEVKIAPEVSGEITHILVSEGDSVKKGQLLLKIRPDKIQTVLDQTVATTNNTKAMASQAEANLGRAKAQFKQAELTFKRNKDLYSQKAISEADFQKAEADYSVAKQELASAEQNLRAANFSVISAQARVKEAQENLYLTQIYAPESGIISKLNVEVGERVVGTLQMAGTELLRIADLRKMEVRVDVNENDIIRVQLGDTAVIDVDAYSQMERKFKGVVTEIASTANESVTKDAVTEFEVRIRILQESFDYLQKEKKIAIPFRPGMTASVDIITDRKSDILIIPLSAVTTRNKNEEQKSLSSGPENENGQGGPEAEEEKETKMEDLKEVVFVNRAGKAKLVEVKTGISDYDNIQVLSGLKKGDEVISGPFVAVSQNLKDDAEIIVKKEEDKKKEKK
jgi:HlyD family secretion protein